MTRCTEDACRVELMCIRLTAASCCEEAELVKLDAGRQGDETTDSMHARSNQGAHYPSEFSARVKTTNRQSLTVVMPLALACLALAFLVPTHYPPWTSFHSQWLTCLGITLLLISSGRRLKRTTQGGSHLWLAWAAAATAGIAAAQVVLGGQTFRSDGIIPALYLVGVAVAISVSADQAAMDRSRWLDWVFASLTAAALLSGGIAVVQWLELSPNSLWLAATPPRGRPYANLGQPNHLATLLVLGLVGLGRAYEHRRIGPTVFGLAVGWLCLALVATQSRSGLLGLAMLAAWWMFAGKRFSARLMPGAIGLGLACIAALAYFWEPLSTQLLLSTAQPLGDRMAAGPRGAIWLQSLDASFRQPWLGYGWNQAAGAQLAVAADHPDLGRQWDSAHNVILDLALAAGWPVAVAWVGLMAAWLWHKCRQARDADDWAALGGILVILVHAMVEYPLEFAYFLAPLALLIGAMEAPGQRAKVLPRAITSGVGVVLLAALLWLGIEYMRVERTHRDIRMSLMNFEGAPSVPPLPANVSLLDAPSALQWLMLSEATESMLGSELDRMRNAAHRYPMPPALLRLALAQGLNGHPADAALTLKRLCAIHPPPRCVEAHEAWSLAEQRWPALSAVPLNRTAR